MYDPPTKNSHEPETAANQATSLPLARINPWQPSFVIHNRCVQIRITSTARRHKLSSSRIRQALANAVFDHMDEDVAIYVGTDDRGLVLELGS